MSKIIETFKLGRLVKRHEEVNRRVAQIESFYIGRFNDEDIYKAIYIGPHYDLFVRLIDEMYDITAAEAECMLKLRLMPEYAAQIKILDEINEEIFKIKQLAA